MLESMDAERIVGLYGNMVYNIAVHILSSREDAEDAYSETFLNYFRKEWTFESEEHRRNWFIRVAINCSYSILRAKPTTSSLDDVMTNILPDRDTSHPDLRMDLQYAINHLPSEQKEIVILYYLQDLSIKEIAEILDIKEGTVKSRLFYARENLSQYLA